MAGLKFRVLLDSKEKDEVFRDVIIPDSATFEDLYKICMQSFGFKGDQMASFYMSNDEWDKGQEVTLEDMSFGDENSSTPIMKNTHVREFIEEPDQKIILVYDFIKMWIFLLELVGYEKDTPAEPIIALSIGVSPREDSRKGDETDIMFTGEFDEFGEDEEEDEFGFNDFDDDYSDDDYSSFDGYDDF
ncbi:MAG: plasmid pRiA4b ORF-3 family protein [Crocinitomicaceae bacterium]|nr:plasmid pRiA4b ORF-3 family protein [Crocinitomicaceae bacterium]